MFDYQFSRTCLAFKAMLCLCGLLIFSASLNAQRRATETYAITNARIVTVSGAPLERATIVIRDGLIESVATSPNAPADARIIDGNGLTVYPGLIDANTNLGFAAPPAPAANQSTGLQLFISGGTTNTLSALNSTQPAGLQPELSAADFIRIGGDQMESWRNAGFTAALTAPRIGIYIGQSAFIQLGGGDSSSSSSGGSTNNVTAQSIILRAPVALHVGFTPLGFAQYPNSLLGVFAALRQSLLDAQRYEQANRIYEANPRGLRRPDTDKSLAALVPVLRGEMPVVMNANTEREITRALDLAEEFHLKVLISGAAESYKVADRLKALNVPVLLSLNFPRRATADVPEADAEPLRILRARVQAAKTAAQLAAGGVRLAFQSGQMTNIADFIANARKSVEQGLSRDAALRAMTLTPAEIFGLSNRLGTLEQGKIANLTVMRGDLFSVNSTLAYLFIDGKQVELKPVAPVTGGVTAIAPGISGAWAFSVKLDQLPEINFQINFQQQGESLAGQLSGDLGASSIANARYNQQTGAISFTAPVTYQGRTLEAAFNGTLSGNRITGTAEAVGVGQAAFTASKIGAPPLLLSPSSSAPSSTTAAPPSTNQPTQPNAANPSATPQLPQTNQPQDVPRTNTPPNEGRDNPANQPRPTAPPPSSSPQPQPTIPPSKN